MVRVLVIAGTRPEIIKLAPVVLEGRAQPQAHVSVCFTGQHRVMAEEAFRMFDILPDHDLDLMRPDQTLNHIGSALMSSLPAVIEDVHPDVLIVQGDTTTAAFSALTGFHCNIPVAHVEAGLRSGRLDAPFPEEANRRLISVVTTYHFCPTERAARTLAMEGVSGPDVHVTGNTVVDALRHLESRFSLDQVESIIPGLKPPFVLITAHRRESFGKRFEQICAGLRDAALALPDHQFVYPVHMNPNIAGPAREYLKGPDNIRLVEPVPYLALLSLLKHCAFVVTDSGGIQEEAPSFGRFSIVLREVTERMESIDAGISELVGSDSDRIEAAIRRQAATPTKVSVDNNPYGDGRASHRIWKVLLGT